MNDVTQKEECEQLMSTETLTRVFVELWFSVFQLPTPTLY